MALSDPWYKQVPIEVGKVQGQATGIQVVGAGNLKYKTVSGDTVDTYAVTAGQIIPVQVTEFLSGTTATGLVGLCR